MNEEMFQEMPCDICGGSEAAEIPCAVRYTNGQPVHVCEDCGFVYVKRRRSPQRIADVWSREIFDTRGPDGEEVATTYTAQIPAVIARLVYVAETLRTEVGTAGKRVCDIGAGEGVFLNMLRQLPFDAKVFGVEPSNNNCRLLAEKGIDNFEGTIESYVGSRDEESSQFDLVTIMWTLENCHSCRSMVSGAYDSLVSGGHLLVATGSRILVPFKKPLHYYFSHNDADTHAFRFSVNTLRALLEVCCFEVVFTNHYIDSDVLCMIGRKREGAALSADARDDYRKVLDFFERWDRDTQDCYSNS